MTTVGVYKGTRADSTKQLFKKQPWEKYLSRFNVEVYGSSRLPSSKQNNYTQIETKSRTANTALSKMLAAFIDTISYLKNHSPDIILQIMRFPTHAPGVALATTLNDIPVITRYMGDNFSEYTYYRGVRRAGMYLFGNWVGRVPIYLSNKIIALGPNMKRDLVKKGARRENIKIVPPLVDLPNKFNKSHDTGEYKNKFELPEEKTVILYAGRLTRMKGMEFLTQVIKKTSGLKNVFYLLVGGGEYQEHFKSEFDENTVRTVGRVPYEEIHNYYKAADVYLHPSPFEGIPLSLLEALQCGVPVLAREAGDIEFITPNIATTVNEMVTMIRNKNWSAEWKHKDYFDIQYGKEKIEHAIHSAIRSS